MKFFSPLCKISIFPIPQLLKYFEILVFILFLADPALVYSSETKLFFFYSKGNFLLFRKRFPERFSGVSPAVLNSNTSGGQSGSRDYLSAHAPSSTHSMNTRPSNYSNFAGLSSDPRYAPAGFSNVPTASAGFSGAPSTANSDVKLVRLPFFDLLNELLKPTTLSMKYFYFC